MNDLDTKTTSIQCEFSVLPLCMSKIGKFIYVGTDQGILRLEESWNAERFLWIGKMKEPATLQNYLKI